MEELEMEGEEDPRFEDDDGWGEKGEDWY